MRLILYTRKRSPKNKKKRAKKIPHPNIKKRSIRKEKKPERESIHLEMPSKEKKWKRGELYRESERTFRLALLLWQHRP